MPSLDVSKSNSVLHMAQNRAKIENLPDDALREIMIQVAGPPNGATDIAVTFSVSKTFQKFSEDEKVLKAVAFKDLCVPQFDESGIRKSNVASRYERFQQVGGLLVRCAKAKDSEAEFMLAKVIMVSASRLYESGKFAKSPLNHVQRLGFLARNSNSSRLAKARIFLEQFSSGTARSGDRLVHFDLVWTFLSQAKVADLYEMRLHLKDYVSYHLEPGMQSAHEQFLTTLDDLENACSRLAATSIHLTMYAENFNALCNMAHNMFHNLGIFGQEELLPLQQSLVPMNDQVRPEMLLQRLSVVEPILELGNQLASERSREERVIIGSFYESALTLKLHLCQFSHAKFFLQNVHLTMASDFGDLFHG